MKGQQYYPIGGIAVKSCETLGGVEYYQAMNKDEDEE